MPDGTVYAPVGGGITTSGHSIEIQEMCDFYARLMKSLETYVEGNTQRMRQLAHEAGHEMDDSPSFRLIVEEDRLLAFDDKSRLAFSVYEFPQAQPTMYTARIEGSSFRPFSRLPQ